MLYMCTEGHSRKEAQLTIAKEAYSVKNSVQRVAYKINLPDTFKLLALGSL